MNTTALLKLSVSQLKRMATLKAQIERLQSRLEALAAETSSSGRKPRRRRRRMSAAARRKISLAAKARWARVRAAKKAK